MEPDGPQHKLILVGGSLLAWHGLRATTLDVDSVLRLDAELSAAAVLVAKRNRLAPRWLNSSAQPFAPVTLEESECEVLAEFDNAADALDAAAETYANNASC